MFERSVSMFTIVVFGGSTSVGMLTIVVFRRIVLTVVMPERVGMLIFVVFGSVVSAVALAHLGDRWAT